MILARSQDSDTPFVLQHTGLLSDVSGSFAAIIGEDVC